jgi:hypothetical protein
VIRLAVRDRLCPSAISASAGATATTTKSRDKNVCLCGRYVAVLTFSVYVSRLGDTPTGTHTLKYSPVERRSTGVYKTACTPSDDWLSGFPAKHPTLASCLFPRALALHSILGAPYVQPPSCLPLDRASIALLLTAEKLQNRRLMAW